MRVSAGACNRVMLCVMKRPRLRREILVLLTIKLIALVGLWYFFFRPALKVHVDPAGVEQRFYDSGQQAPDNGS